MTFPRQLDQLGMDDRPPFDLTCFLYPAWRPIIEPASSRRGWMDASPEAFAYRCLPLNIANSHGWEIINPHGFEAEWNGGGAPGDVSVRLDPGHPPHEVPTGLFGQGTLTFNIPGLFQTPAGWNLWVGGSPNHAKDGIAPLGGVIETDWSPFTFTMNWRFTRPHHRVRFEAGEPIAFLMPVERDLMERVRPRFRPIAEAPELQARFEAWTKSRDAFHKAGIAPGAAPADKWQKHYYRGVDAAGEEGIADHRTKLRVAPFEGAPPARCPVIHPAPETAAAESPLATDLARSRHALAKREWLLEALERQRQLSDQSGGFYRVPAMAGELFLQHFYAPARPVILTGALEGWPAGRWTPQHLAQRIGAATVDYRGRRHVDPDDGRAPNDLRSTPFAALIGDIAAGRGDAFLASHMSAANNAAFAPLQADLGALDPYLNGAPGAAMIALKPPGLFTPLHHDLANHFVAQLVGAKRVRLVPPGEIGRLYNEQGVASAIGDLDQADPRRFPRAQNIRTYDFVLQAGDLLFVPLGWSYQYTEEGFSASASFVNFRWPNDAGGLYPAERAA